MRQSNEYGQHQAAATAAKGTGVGLYDECAVLDPLTSTLKVGCIQRMVLAGQYGSRLQIASRLWFGNKDKVTAHLQIYSETGSLDTDEHLYHPSSKTEIVL